MPTGRWTFTLARRRPPAWSRIGFTLPRGRTGTRGFDSMARRRQSLTRRGSSRTLKKPSERPPVSRGLRPGLTKFCRPSGPLTRKRIRGRPWLPRGWSGEGEGCGQTPLGVGVGGTMIRRLHPATRGYSRWAPGGAAGQGTDDMFIIHRSSFVSVEVL